MTEDDIDTKIARIEKVLDTTQSPRRREAAAHMLLLLLEKRNEIRRQQGLCRTCSQRIEEDAPSPQAPDVKPVTGPWPAGPWPSDDEERARQRGGA
jgi:hypothetical protein